MARGFAVLFLLTCVSSMEMRETVERMVMVRTTGSDLQPAATGFIYKKDSDGPASVVKLEESEVMEQLSKMYEQPQTFEAPIPVAAGPFHAKENEDKSAALSSESKTIPVVEAEENNEPVDGLADEEYGKIFAEYASDYGNYNSDFDDYLKSLGHFEDGVFQEHSAGDNKKSYDLHEETPYKGFGIEDQYESGGDYLTEKYESYKVSGQDNHEKEHDDADNGKYYAGGHGYTGQSHGLESRESDKKAGNGFYKIIDQKKKQKDHDSYDGDAVKSGLHKFNGGYGSEESDARGYGKEGFHASDFRRKVFGDSNAGGEDDRTESKGDRSFQHKQGFFSPKFKIHRGESYDYHITH